MRLCPSGNRLFDQRRLERVGVRAEPLLLMLDVRCGGQRQGVQHMLCFHQRPMLRCFGGEHRRKAGFQSVPCLPCSFDEHALEPAFGDNRGIPIVGCRFHKGPCCTQLIVVHAQWLQRVDQEADLDIGKAIRDAARNRARKHNFYVLVRRKPLHKLARKLSTFLGSFIWLVPLLSPNKRPSRQRHKTGRIVGYAWAFCALGDFVGATALLITTVNLGCQTAAVLPANLCQHRFRRGHVCGKRHVMHVADPQQALDVGFVRVGI